MAARFASAAVGIPILFVAIWFGGIYLEVVVLVAAILGLGEVYKLATAAGARPPLIASGLIAASIIVGAFIYSVEHGASHGTVVASLDVALVVIIFMVLLMAYVFGSRRLHTKGLVAGWALALGGAFYVGLLATAVLLRYVGEGPDYIEGRKWLLFALFTTFATDTGAYFIGRFFGRVPLAPSISPKKTQEGALAGFICAEGAALGLGAIMCLPVAAWQQALIGLAVGIVSQVGDLTESKLKRLASAKDASKLIPGHGGMLDRMDSLVFAFPVVYYLVTLVLKR